MPAVILTVTPIGETSSAMAFNQVVRSVGFSLGSAVGGLVLAAHPHMFLAPALMASRIRE
jgi:predicted MFS family arabinose efflux permease